MTRVPSGMNWRNSYKCMSLGYVCGLDQMMLEDARRFAVHEDVV